MKVPYINLQAQYEEQRDEILAAVDGVFKSGQYILGEEVAKFETAFAQLCGVKHAIGVADGTVGLSLIMRALKIGAGDEVITAPNSFFSSASSIVHVGATPTFCDVADDFNMDPKLLEKKITARTKAIMPVHLTGKVADMNPILEIARKYNIYVIEDAAQAVSAEYMGKRSGSMGVAGSFSLHPLKNLNGCGDSGVITTNDDALAKQIKLIRNHGMVNRDTIVEWGYNARLDTLQAAILNVKLKYLDQTTEARRKNAALYRSLLNKKVKCPLDAPNSKDVYHLFVIECDRRNELKEYLSTHEIETAIHYPTPIHLLDVCRKMGHKEGEFLNVERQSKRILSLPIHQYLSEDQIKFCVQKIYEFYV